MPDPTTTVRLGVAFRLNNKDIFLNPEQAISEVREKGMELSLPDSLHLGKAGEGIDSILKELGSDWRTQEKTQYTDASEVSVQSIRDNLPAFTPLEQTYEKLISAQLYIDKFHVKIPGTIEKANNPQASTEYTIGLSARWDPSVNSKDSSSMLTLTGIYLQVSNESQASLPPEGSR